MESGMIGTIPRQIYLSYLRDEYDLHNKVDKILVMEVNSEYSYFNDWKEKLPSLKYDKTLIVDKDIFPETDLLRYKSTLKEYLSGNNR